MTITKTFIKFWSAAHPEKMEGWLERMESEGWHLVQVHWGGVKFIFERGQSSRVRYCIDYRANADADYLGLLKDAGWELMLNRSGWLIWRMPYDGPKPEVYTDIDSLIARNNRLLSVYGALFVMQIPIATLNVQHFNLLPILFVYIPLALMLAVLFIRALLANRKLKAVVDAP